MHTTTTFDIERARARQDEIIREVQNIRDEISKEVVNYYYDLHPDSEEEERKYREGMRWYLKNASGRIQALLNGRLS